MKLGSNEKSVLYDAPSPGISLLVGTHVLGSWPNMPGTSTNTRAAALMGKVNVSLYFRGINQILVWDIERSSQLGCLGVGACIFSVDMCFIYINSVDTRDRKYV